MATVVRGQEANGWVGLDDFTFIDGGNEADCPIEPPDAKPPQTTSTSTAPPPGSYEIPPTSYKCLISIKQKKRKKLENVRE